MMDQLNIHMGENDLTHFINGPQKALTIKQMFNKCNYVQMTPVNNMRRQVIEDSYPELCKELLQSKKKKDADPWSELQKPNCSTRPIMKISRTMSCSSNLIFIPHRSNPFHLIAFYYILFIFLSKII